MQNRPVSGRCSKNNSNLDLKTSNSPLNTHGSKREYGAEGTDILDVVKEFAGGITECPRVRHQLDHLDGNADADEEKVCCRK